jgi:hypothetical protein
MPIVYRIDPAAGLLETACQGDVALEEVLQHFAELGTLTLPPRLDVLLDLSDMTSLPDSGQIRIAADTLTGLRHKTSWGACAVVAKQDVIFGMSRMFGVYAEQVFARVHVCREPDEAKRWLAKGASG